MPTPIETTLEQKAYIPGHFIQLTQEQTLNFTNGKGLFFRDHTGNLLAYCRHKDIDTKLQMQAVKLAIKQSVNALHGLAKTVDTPFSKEQFIQHCTLIAEDLLRYTVDGEMN